MPQDAASTERDHSWRWRLPHISRRTWLLFTFALIYLIGFNAWELSTDWQHRRLASQLRRLGTSVEFENRDTVASTRAFVPTAVKKFWHTYIFRRIYSVTVRLPNGSPNPEKDYSPAPERLSESLDCIKLIGAFEELTFYDTGIDQHLLADLMAHIRIKSLYIPSVSLPRTNITWLGKQQLSWLCVARTQFSNPAIDDLPLSLTYFDATRTRINDEGLSSFCRLKNLKSLKLLRTPTTHAAIVRLRQQMPWCKIDWEPMRTDRS